MPKILKTFELIESFTKLPKGWNFGEGVPASLVTLELSQELLRVAYHSGHKEVDAFPGIGGEIQLCFYNEDDTLEITSEVNGTVTICVEKDDEIILFKENVTFTDAIKILKDFTYNKCHSYVSSTSTTTTIERRSAYLVWHLDPRQQTVVSPLLTGNALRGRAEAFVDISSNTIRRLPETRLFFGKSPMSEYRKIAKVCRV